MRALFLLHGAPGSGKTRLIDELGVAHLAIGYDAARDLFSAPFPCVDEGEVSSTARLTPEADRAAVDLVHEALRARCAAGTTVFFDSTNSRVANQTSLARIARRYGYRTWLIDVQADTALDVLLERNRRRGRSRVDEQSLRSMHARCADKTFSAELSGVLDGTDVAALRHRLRDVAAVPRVEAEDVAVVGDVHSCAEALADAVRALDTARRHWVFCGDLFDRGPDPVGVWTIVHRLADAGRATVVTGNHEVNLRGVAAGTAPARMPDTRLTHEALLAAGIGAAEQIGFVDATVPAVRLTVGPATWLITHAGVGEPTVGRLDASGLLDVSDAECVYGLSERGATYRARTSYNVQDMPLVGCQLHGHRRGRPGERPVETITHDRHGLPVVCLESGASTGGAVSVAVFERGAGPVVHRVDDRMPAAAERPVPHAPAPQDARALVARMRASDQVKVRPVEGLDGVVAANFTSDAFAEGVWNDVTIHARGLFVDETAGRIAARGYEKFFHVGERPGRTLDEWLDPAVTAYPVIARKKYDGYLALAASIHGSLVVFSKSGITDWSRFADRLLTDAVGADGRVGLADMLGRTDTTAAFEVITARDPHPITEPGPDRLVLLDCIRNQVRFATHDAIRAGVSRRFGFDVAETVAVASNPDALRRVLSEALRRDDEGIVIVDARGYRSKVKADEYATRKQARGALHRVWRHRADTLGPRFADLETRMRAAGLFDRLDEYAVLGVDGVPRLNLSALFDDLRASGALGDG